MKGDLALEATANSQFTWQMRGLDDPTRRGQDSFDEKKQRLYQEVETSRKRDPLIFRGVDYYDKLGIGIGIELSSDCPETDFLAYAEAVWEANSLDDGQHQASNELVTTANLFTRVPISFDGDIPTIEQIPSTQIELIATKDGRPWYYRRRWEELIYPEPKLEPQKGRRPLAPKIQVMYEDIPAAEIVHTAINRTAGELRGTSMLEPTIYWSSLYGRTLETIWSTAVAKSMVGVHVTIDNPTLEAVNLTKAALEAQLITKTDPRGQAYKTSGTGQYLITGPDIKMEEKSSNITGGSSENEIRRILLMAGVGMGTPEYILSDGNSTNVATSESQSDPYFRMMQAHQYVIIKHFHRVYRLVFDRLVAAGRFVGLTKPEGKFHIADWLKMTAPNLLTPDVETLGPVAVQLVNAKIWSRQYANEQLGSDWKEISDQILEEEKAGFKSEPQPGLQLPPSSRASQNQITLPLAASVAVDDTPAETPTLKSKNVTKRLLAAFREELTASKGDKGKIDAAYRKFLDAAKTEMFELIDETREMGAQSVAA